MLPKRNNKAKSRILATRTTEAKMCVLNEITQVAAFDEHWPADVEHGAEVSHGAGNGPC